MWSSQLARVLCGDVLRTCPCGTASDRPMVSPASLACEGRQLLPLFTLLPWTSARSDLVVLGSQNALVPIAEALARLGGKSQTPGSRPGLEGAVDLLQVSPQATLAALGSTSLC